MTSRCLAISFRHSRHCSTCRTTAFLSRCRRSFDANCLSRRSLGWSATSVSRLICTGEGRVSRSHAERLKLSLGWNARFRGGERQVSSELATIHSLFCRRKRGQLNGRLLGRQTKHIKDCWQLKITLVISLVLVYSRLAAQREHFPRRMVLPLFSDRKKVGAYAQCFTLRRFGESQANRSSRRTKQSG
jgi:hypothetical protein